MLRSIGRLLGLAYPCIAAVAWYFATTAGGSEYDWYFIPSVYRLALLLQQPEVMFPVITGVSIPGAILCLAPRQGKAFRWMLRVSVAALAVFAILTIGSSILLATKGAIPVKAPRNGATTWALHGWNDVLAAAVAVLVLSVPPVLLALAKSPAKKETAATRH